MAEAVDVGVVERVLFSHCPAGLSAATLGNGIEFARAAHRGQYRLSRLGETAVPFLVHPLSVAILAAQWAERCGIAPSLRGTAVLAGVLHDVLEDTETSFEDVWNEFGEGVASLVHVLTRPGLRDGESRSDREQRFLGKLRRAGPLAAFVKMCDVADNCSGAYGTPNHVVSSARRRGSKCAEALLPVLGECSEFTSFVNGQLGGSRPSVGHRDADQVVSVVDSPRMPIQGSERAEPVDRFMRVDLHDAAKLCELAWPGVRAGVYQLTESGALGYVAGSVRLGADARVLRVVNRLQARRGGFAWLACEDVSVECCDAAPVSVALWMERLLTGGWVCLVAVSPRAETETVFLQAAMAGAVARARVASDRLFADVAAEAGSVRCDVDLTKAFGVGVQRGELTVLAAMRRDTEAACRLLANGLREVLGGSVDKQALWHRVSVEYRVKTINSVLDKALKGRWEWPAFSKLVDLGGVRVVCPTACHCEEVLELVVGGGSLAGCSVNDEVCRYDINPTMDGYRAIHVPVCVTVPRIAQPVTCELQLRTALQDAWATVAHKASYKRNAPRADRKAKRELRVIADAIASSDENLAMVFRASGSFVALREQHGAGEGTT